MNDGGNGGGDQDQDDPRNPKQVKQFLAMMKEFTPKSDLDKKLLEGILIRDTSKSESRALEEEEANRVNALQESNISGLTIISQDFVDVRTRNSNLVRPAFRSR